MYGVDDSDTEPYAQWILGRCFLLWCRRRDGLPRAPVSHWFNKYKHSLGMKTVKMIHDSSPINPGETGIQSALRYKKMAELKKETQEAMLEAMVMKASGTRS